MNCKPPCMALIVKSDFPELLGLPVDVPGETVDYPNLGFCWVVRLPRPMPCWDFDRQCDILHDVIAVPDYCLRQITGLPVHDEQLDEVTA
ncbi:hypothetical protein G3N59_01190 [Paraburkholderia sp. Ac-20340]|uniref:hypothetical protein n=1 Tax=Paraburkholderia sp. Ac-20340 TaxID=2703888 RepID=UPI0019813313|nr:hypothetical protein [Paraburkholderia sp. Ac-20340]MBN3851982.1 hypothetical protein [Paraburkholderia sp. Ac-20340]